MCLTVTFEKQFQVITLEKTSDGVKTFFFGLHSMFGGKLDVGAPEGDFGGGHALRSFGPGWQTNTIWNRYFDKTNLLLSVTSS